MHLFQSDGYFYYTDISAVDHVSVATSWLRHYLKNRNSIGTDCETRHCHPVADKISCSKILGFSSFTSVHYSIQILHCGTKLISIYLCFLHRVLSFFGLLNCCGWAKIFPKWNIWESHDKMSYTIEAPLNGNSFIINLRRLSSCKCSFQNIAKCVPRLYFIFRLVYSTNATYDFKSN